MKKSTFIAMVLGVISCLFFGVGMCMALLPEWNAFTPGVVLGVIGAVVAFLTVIVWRKMENKTPIKLSGKTIGIICLAIIGSLVLGIGMCLVMVWQNLILGIVIGIVGIVLLLCLFPLCMGLK